MMNQLFQPIPNMLIEALTISDQNKAFLYDIIKHGATGASTFDLQAEQHGNISAKVKKLRELGVVIHTVFLDVTDKRGNLLSMAINFDPVLANKIDPPSVI